MALAWNAGWVHALGGSNPPSSATAHGDLRPARSEVAIAAAPTREMGRRKSQTLTRSFVLGAVLTRSLLPPVAGAS